MHDFVETIMPEDNSPTGSRRTERQGSQSAANKLVELLAIAPDSSPPLLVACCGSDTPGSGVVGGVLDYARRHHSRHLHCVRLGHHFWSIGCQSSRAATGVGRNGGGGDSFGILRCCQLFASGSYALVELVTSRDLTSAMVLGNFSITSGERVVAGEKTNRFVVFRNEMGQSAQPCFVVYFGPSSEPKSALIVR